jgi:hypothetical protein
MKGLFHVELKSIERADKIDSLPGWTKREFTAIPSRNLVEQARLGLAIKLPAAEPFVISNIGLPACVNPYRPKRKSKLPLLPCVQ